MADPERTQKEISTRYHGNIAYRGRIHPWRLARIIVTALAIIGGIVGAVWYQRHGRQDFFNPGTIARPHQKFANDCEKCHQKPPPDVASASATVARRFHGHADLQSIDRNCEQCHQQHALHEPNVVENRSCSACHQEHRGLNSLRRVANVQCAACHNNDEVMQASAQKGMQLPPDAFHIHPHRPPQIVFEMPRPPRGYTAVFASFADQHPEFQVVREHAVDPDKNALKFNHQRHLGGNDIPQVNGKKLDCAYCHATDVEGRFYQRISFEANCKACHSLQFDLKNPEMQLPHGDAAAVRGYLYSVRARYEQLAVTKGIRQPQQISLFADTQIRQLLVQAGSGENLERQIFFTSRPNESAPAPTARRPAFYGCALCHEVKAEGANVPSITPVKYVDRWMPQAHFNHAKHTSVRCDQCHAARQSSDTGDVLMPGKASCITCHSPAGTVSSDCMTCHTYHAPPQTSAAVAAGPAGAGIVLKNLIR